MSDSLASEKSSAQVGGASTAAAPAARLWMPARAAAFDWRGLLLDAFLLSLIAVGVVLRFNWNNWNQGADLHPDEYGLTATLTRLSIPQSLDDYFNTRLSPISPYNKYDADGLLAEYGPDNRMRWGQWPITIIRWAAEATDNTGYTEMRLLGRKLSALADSLALALTFLIGWRLYNYRLGLLAAALSALAVMQIQQAHFMTADNFAVLFTMLAMYSAARAAQRDGWIWYGLFGVAFGMALASRINLLPLFGMILVAAFIADAEELAKGSGDLAPGVAGLGLRIALAAAAAVVTFRVTQPMSFRAERGDTTIFTLNPNPDWADSMGVAQAESNGIGGGPPGEQWTNRPAIIFPWVNMVLWGMGLPLGLMAWAGLGWAAARSLKGREWRAHLLPLVWAGGYFVFMGTRWVKSIRYFLPIYPFLAMFAAWGLIELWRVASRRPAGGGRASDLLRLSFKVMAAALFASVMLGTLAWAWGFTSIYRHDNTRIQASRWIYQNVPAAFNVQIQSAGGGLHTEPISIPYGTTITGDYAIAAQFDAKMNGTITGINVGFARNMFSQDIPAVVRVVLGASADGSQPLARAEVRIEPTTGDERGGSFSAPLGPAAVEKGRRYYLFLTAPEGGPVIVTGATVSNESWDEGLPLRIDGRDAFGGLYRGLTMEMRWGDDENKRQMLLANLAQVDYIFLPSQRALWSASRLPNTYPMTMEYYRALFDGRLGFDLVAHFQSPIQLGPLQISDVGGSWAWGSAPSLPLFNNNPLAAEEAFSVYDHAPVWIFKKRPDFTIERAQAILNAVDLSSVVAQGPREATAAPTLLMLPPDRLAEQRAGGTWSQMFNPDGLLNKFEPLGVIVWWLTAVLLGWLAFPLTFAAFGGLRDRGYSLARNVSLLLMAWLAWALGSLRIMPFTQLTLWLIAAALGALSGIVVWRRWREVKAWLAEHRRYLIRVEAFALALFVFFLLIRWGNADLWHPAYGGEKPMDFSYFNAVLKSTSFPPYDPWFAGGYLNYYYFGFVIVGVLTKMLGVVPSFAYNLILPTLFSLAGVGAFGVAFNLVAGSWKWEVGSGKWEVGGGRWTVGERGSTRDTQESDQPAVFNPKPANPYLAGTAAALLFVVLGNLGELRVIQEALTRAAQDVQPLIPLDFFTTLQRAAVGLWRIYVEGAPVLVGTGEWYWNATRVIPDSQVIPITEFPFFTFLYADLHAHMIVLTMAVIALGWCAAVVRGAARRGQPLLEQAALWGIGGLAFGVIRPSNLSDFQTYWALGCVAIVYGEFRRRGRIGLPFIYGAAWRCALLIGLAAALFYPYSAWRGEGYGEIELWKGDKTTLGAYLTIHGLFLFIIVSFLLVETRRWMQRTMLDDVKDLIRPALFVLIAFAALVAALAALGYTVALIALPLMAWTGLLMIRREAEPERRAALGLIGLGLLLTVVVEVVVAKGDIGRMNTVFKFYLQVWTFFSVASGAALAWTLAQTPQWSAAGRKVWQFSLSALVTAAAAYTLMATSAKVSDRMARAAPRTLDGMAYMAYAQYADQGQTIDLKWDYEAIRWMQRNIAGSPVIVEVNTPEYRWGSRYTINTGLPGVVGWSWHQRQQRVVVPDRLVTDRVAAIGDFYSTLSEEAALDFLRKYDVSYVVVGGYERAYYPAESLAKFARLAQEGLLSAAYRNEGTVIYKVVKDTARFSP